MYDVRRAMTFDDQLDDVTRARIWTRLATRLGQPQRRAPRWPIAFAVGAIAAAASVALVLRGRIESHGGVEQLALTAPAHATVSARLGPHTQAALVGPAHLAVVGDAGDRTTVRLDAGTLYARF